MDGFTLPELLIATLLSMVVMSAVFLVVQPANAVFQAQLETTDLQQRLRYAADTLARDLAMAEEVLPYRAGAVGHDPAFGVFYRPDVVTARYVPPGQVARVSFTYYLRFDNTTGAFQLMQYDGGLGDFPVVDNVLQLGFRYLGDPRPPLVFPPPDATVDPDPQDEYPAGENCLFVRAAGIATPRLPTLGNGVSLQLLHNALLSDGPWCPSGTAPDRIDADVLRVRRVGVTLRLQVGQRSLRGPAGALFSRGGTASLAHRYVPDREITFEVAPRNVGMPR